MVYGLSGGTVTVDQTTRPSLASRAMRRPSIVPTYTLPW
jgi:hypothetical protein